MLDSRLQAAGYSNQLNILNGISRNITKCKHVGFSQSRLSHIYFSELRIYLHSIAIPLYHAKFIIIIMPNDDIFHADWLL